MTTEEAIKILDPETSRDTLMEMMGGTWNQPRAMELLQEAQRMGLQALRAQQNGGWISVNDALPEVYVAVLVYCPNTKMARKIEIDYLERLHWSDEWKHGPVTHWQPLPSPPPKGE